MKTIKYIALSLFAAYSLNTAAQTAKSAYFLEGAFHNSQLNPAMNAERNYFSIPTLGNMTCGVNSNIGLSNFLYPQENGKLATFMSGKVSAKQFLDDFPSTARIGMNVDMTVAALGFRAFGGYNTFNVTMKTQTSVGIPEDIFRFVKTGLKTDPYSFAGINMNAMSYMAFTVGHSREVIDGLRVGVNLKYLVGLAYADLLVDNLTLETGRERWLLEAHAQARLASLVDLSMTEDGEFNMNLEEMNANSFTPSATGFAVDLGATYDMENIVSGLKLSASITNLGSIKWNMIKANTGNIGIEYNGLGEIDPENVSDIVEEKVNGMMEKLEEQMTFTIEDRIEEKTSLGATMYLGAEYEIPCYRKLSLGVLYGQRFDKYTGWYDVRGYLNLSPLKWLEASANVSRSTFGTTMGWMFNFHPKLLSFFIGSDYMITRVNPQYIPVNEVNSNVTLGINIPFGKRR